jgi:hypothetical protein
LNRRAHLALATLACCLLCAPAGAGGQQLASISAGFSPYRLGAPTALSLGFRIGAVGGGLPSALTGIEFRYPRGLGLGTAELGLASCQTSKLKLEGPKACPRNSIMGAGSALAEFQVSPIVNEEHATIALVAGPSKNGYVNMLISATGVSPVQARIVMETLLLPGELAISVPLVPSIPEGPDVAVVAVNVTLGGPLTYHVRRHGRTIAFHPRGVQLPRRCPAGGFRFSATFSFLDGSSAQAQTVLGCPRR